MNKRSKIQRVMAVLAMGGMTFFLFGFSTFDPASTGCNYAYNSDYDTMFETAGNAMIQRVSDNFFSFGTDWDAFVRTPTTTFAQNVWGNWLDAQIPDDLPNNAVVLR